MNTTITVSLAEWLQKARTYSPHAQEMLEWYKKMSLGSYRKIFEVFAGIKIFISILVALVVIFLVFMQNVKLGTFTPASISKSPNLAILLLAIVGALFVVFLPLYRFIKRRQRMADIETSQPFNKEIYANLPFNPELITITYKFSDKGISVSTSGLHKEKHFVVFPWKYITSFIPHSTEQTIENKVNYFDRRPEQISQEDKEHIAFLESIYVGMDNYQSILKVFQEQAGKKS